MGAIIVQHSTPFLLKERANPYYQHFYVLVGKGSWPQWATVFYACRPDLRCQVSEFAAGHWQGNSSNLCGEVIELERCPHCQQAPKEHRNVKA